MNNTHTHEPITHHRVDQLDLVPGEEPDLSGCDEYMRCAVCGLATPPMFYGESAEVFREATS